MSKKIKLLEIDIDIDALIRSGSIAKKKIDELKKAQIELKKEGDTSSKQFVRNAAELKALNEEYRTNVKAVSVYTQVVAGSTKNENLMSIALKKQVTSIVDARTQNKLLNTLRNEVNVTTKEGRELLDELNTKLDENNQFIKENSDAYTRQKINIGNYKDGIKEAFDEINIFNGGLSGFVERSREAGGVGTLVKGSLAGMAQGFAGVTKASLAFIATPIGAILAVLVGAFALVKAAMGRSEKATNKLKKSFAIITGVFNTVLKALEPVGEFLIDGIVMGFELAAEAADKAIGLISKGLSFLGFDSASESVENWRNEIKSGIKTAQNLADAEARLEKAQRKSQSTQLDYQKAAEKLRQIRDDENLTTKERIQANEKLGLVLKNQLNDELDIAQLALKAANLRVEAEGETTKTLDAQAAAMTKIKEIQERITGQESEQLTNRVSLQKEARERATAMAKERIDTAIKESKTLLDIYIAEQSVKAKTLQEELTFAKNISNKKKEILKAELKAKKITQSEYTLAIIELDNELVNKRAEIAIDNATRELQIFKDTHQTKLEANNFFTEELLNQEVERLDLIAQKEIEYHKKRLEQGVINQQEYHNAINAIDEENRIAKEELQIERDEAKKEQQAIDLENQRLIDEENFLTEFEIKANRLENNRLQEIENAKNTGADIDKINEKYKLRQEKLDKELAKSKIASAGATFGVIADLLGESSKAGKAFALAQALINTYQGITAGVALGYPAAIPAVAAAAATGFAAVKNITSTKTPKAEKGLAIDVGGQRHSSGGTKFFGEDGTAFEAEKGEKMFVLNRRASAALGPLLSDINQQYGGISLSRYSNYLASGGQILRGIGSSTTQSTSNIDYEALGLTLAEANRELPAPVVLVEDINNGQANVAEVINGANL